MTSLLRGRPKTRRHWLVLVGIRTLLGGLAIALWFLWLRSRPPLDRLGWIQERVRQRFPDAPQISPAELASRLDDGEDIVLLDVRRPDEFAVSHLPGAFRVDPGATDLPPEARERVRNGAEVVAYCSVGWRSSEVVERLRERGIDAENLEGSIFRWVGEGRSVVRDGEEVEVVHPYDENWAWLLAPEHRAEISAP